MADGNWSLAEAQEKLGEVVDRALRDGPQHISRHGQPAVVVVMEEEWLRRAGQSRSFTEVLFDPSARFFTDEERRDFFERDKSVGRDIEF